MPVGSELLPEQLFTKTKKIAWPLDDMTFRHFQINRNNLEQSLHIIKAYIRSWEKTSSALRKSQ
jgi:hypothetical protein